jgi:hypothetical protein
MKTKFLLLTLVLISNLLKAQTTFQKTYDAGATSDFGKSVRQTTDGGFIITGMTSLGAGPSDMYLVKTDSYGALQWSKSFGGDGNEVGYCVRQTADGGFIVIGNTDTDVEGGPWDMYLVKTDSDGELEWSKTFGGPGIEEGRSVQETSDGGFIITGNTTGFDGESDVYLIKTTSDGTLEWTRTYGYALGTDMGESVKQTSDGGYIIAGYTSGESFDYDAYIVKTDSIGMVEWTKTFGDALDDKGYDIQQTTDGGFVMVGNFGREVVEDEWTWYFADVYLVKMAADGTMEWNKTYGNSTNAIGYHVEQMADGGYFICGERSGPYLLKTTSDGTLQWSKTYGPMADGKTSAQLATDGGFIITGTIINDETFDMYLINTDSTGNSGCNEIDAITLVNSGGGEGTGGEQGTGVGLSSNIETQTASNGIETTICSSGGTNEIPEQHLSVSIFPNPFSSHTILHTDYYFDDATLTVYNSFGQIVKEIKNISGHTVTVFGENLPEGMYFFQLSQDSEVISSQKVVISH